MLRTSRADIKQLIVIPAKPSVQHTEQAINQVIMLKQFVLSVNPIYEALTGARTEMLSTIRNVGLCKPEVMWI